MEDKKFEKVGLKISLVLGVLTLLIVLYALVYDLEHKFPIERAVKKWMPEGQELSRAKWVNEKIGVAFINYDCKSMKVLEGIKRCNGQYYVFVDKVGDAWVVNELSKAIIW